MLKLHDYQSSAVELILREFSKSGRAQCILPCGTGKTLVGIHAKKRLKSSRTLIVTPSLSLIDQLIRSYSSERALKNILVVCSDQTTATEARTIYNIVNVTTDAKEVAKQLRANDELTVFSTYVSTPRIAKAFKGRKVKGFDLAIFDEAHHMTGSSRIATTSLDDKKIPVANRLFMTATPRIATTSIAKKVEEEGLGFSSMDDPSKFGNVAYTMSVSQAIEGNYLTDYQLCVFVITESEVKESIKGFKNAKELAKQVCLAKAIRDYSLQQVFTFHSSIQSIKRFMSGFETVAEKTIGTSTKIDHLKIEGTDNSSKRKEIIRRFGLRSDSFVRVLSSCKTIGEGVDCPAADAVFFADPKACPVDINQSVGRAIRNSKDKKLATIVIPVFLPDSAENDIEGYVASSPFSHVLDIISAMKNHDDRIQCWINSIAKGGKPSSSIVKVNSNFPVSFSTKFIRAIESRVVKCFREKTEVNRANVLAECLKWEERTGKWPNQGTKGITAFGILWSGVNQKIRLSPLRKYHYGFFAVTRENVLAECLKLENRTGKWPCQNTKGTTAFGISWSGVYHKINLSRLRKEHYGTNGASE